MEHLPVPPLAQTLQKYLGALHPLLSPQELRQSQAAVAETLAGDGPACQAALEEFAATEGAHGRSWLSAAWLHGYLAARTPLALTSNVGFQIRVPVDAEGPISAPLQGMARAAAVIQTLASVHLASLRGELPAEETPRGEAVCGVQREVLAGGVRHPSQNVDEVRDATPDPAHRAIGLL
ncbi:MAG: choline/carnitine O-acyltransferase, partial [Ornithinimicrobium sp.]